MSIEEEGKKMPKIIIVIKKQLRFFSLLSVVRLMSFICIFSLAFVYFVHLVWFVWLSKNRAATERKIRNWWKERNIAARRIWNSIFGLGNYVSHFNQFFVFSFLLGVRWSEDRYSNVDKLQNTTQMLVLHESVCRMRRAE